MAHTYKRTAVLAASVLVTIGAAWYFVHSMRGQWGAMGRAFAQANYVYLLPAVGFLALMYALRVVRWSMFLKSVGGAPASAVAEATLIGFMSSCVLPLRPGEVIRPYVLHRRTGIPFGSVAGTAIGLERAFDLVGTLFLLLVTWLLLWAQAGELSATTGGEEQIADVLGLLQRGGLQFAALAAVGMIGLGMVAFFPAFMLRVADVCLRVLPGRWHSATMRFLGSIAESMAFLKSPAQVAAAILLTCAAWACYPLSTYSLARGFDLALPLSGALLVQVFITVAVIAPQAPGFFGTYQAAATGAALVFGVPGGNAGAFANMLWAINVFPVTIVGLALLSRRGISLGQLARGARQAAQEEA